MKVNLNMSWPVSQCSGSKMSRCQHCFFVPQLNLTSHTKYHSKDGKFNQAQIILSILVTKQRLPVGYQVYSGSTFEGNTLEDAFEILRLYDIKHITTPYEVS